MSAPQPKEIRFVCVARRDGTVVAQHTHVPSATVNYMQNVRGVLGSPKWATLQSNRLTLTTDNGENTFYVLIDDAGRVFIAVTSAAYPGRAVYDSADGKTEGFLNGGWPDPRPLASAVWAGAATLGRAVLM